MRLDRAPKRKTQLYSLHPTPTSITIMCRIIFLLAILSLVIATTNASFLPPGLRKNREAAPEQEQQPPAHPLLRQLGLHTLDLFNEDPSLYVTRGCPERSCKPVSFFVNEIQSDVLDEAECTGSSDCEGAYSCRYIDPSEDYSRNLLPKDTGFVCAHHARVANVCDLPCVERDIVTLQE